MLSIKGQGAASVRAVFISFIFLLSGCGGGGGDGGSDTTAAGTPLSNDTVTQGDSGGSEPSIAVESSDNDTTPYITGDGCLNTETLETRVIELINEIRSQTQYCGLVEYGAAPAVSWNERLEGAALNHSQDMAINDFFSHIGTDSSDVGDRATLVEYDWRRIAENIAAGQSSIERVMQDWLDSPPHCAAMMNSRYQEVGVSCHDNGSATYGRYWTMVLGTHH
jgi:uncharacterized protein YkwD